MISAFLLPILPLVAGNKVTGRYRQFGTSVTPRRNTQEAVEYVWPAFRYETYSKLGGSNIAAADALGYTEDSWNSPGTADIEAIAFSDLSDDQKTAATNLGFTEDTWDCDQNHYHGYWWTELEEYGLDVHYEALGYDESSWNGDTDPPDSANLTWAELGEDQQDAAEELCYYEETWDMVPLDQWYVAPTIRYDTFSDLTDVDAAEKLGYTEESWNSPGTAAIEGLAFADLSDDQQIAATTLGFAEHTWDCYQNHYTGYAWSDLQEYQLDVHWKALGYDQESWEGTADPPAAADLFWAELDEAQQDAAEELCYSEKTWNMVPLDEWE